MTGYDALNAPRWAVMRVIVHYKIATFGFKTSWGPVSIIFFIMIMCLKPKTCKCICNKEIVLYFIAVNGCECLKTIVYWCL